VLSSRNLSVENFATPERQISFEARISHRLRAPPLGGWREKSSILVQKSSQNYSVNQRRILMNVIGRASRIPCPFHFLYVSLFCCGL
jgi:hypothetical protein